MNPLTEEQRKLLTEFLGECWHEWETKEEAAARADKDGNEETWPECKNCHARRYHTHENRTFDNWQDFGALKEALVKKGLWEEFGLFSFEEWIKDHIACGNFADWLIDKDRFPELVAEFMEVKK